MKGFQIKITIKGSKPPVWRRIVVPVDFTFYQLHRAIQIAFGWQDYHLYDFTIPMLDITIENPEDEWDDYEDDYEDDLEGNFTMENLLFHILGPKLKMIYTYDYGDDWEHIILVESMIDIDERKAYLVKWKGDNFAEDAGNVWGYQEIYAIANDPNHPEQKDMQDWLDMQHIPFDPNSVNEQLGKIDGMDHHKDDYPISSEVYEELSDEVMALRDILEDFEINNIALLITDTGETREPIAVSSMDEGISLQIFDNETDFLRGVENASEYMEFNLYANSFSILMLDEPLILEYHDGWISKDQCCTIKRMRTGFLPCDINEEEAIKILRILRNLQEMLNKAVHKKLPDVREGHMMVGTWNRDHTLQLSYPEVKLFGDMTTIHLIDRQKKELSSAKLYPHKVRIDLITCPSHNFRNTNHMDILFVLEDDDIIICEPLDRNAFEPFERLNMEVLSMVCSFIEQNGRMKSIAVNNDNVHLMLEGLCEDLHIPLYTESFITDTQREILGPIEEEDPDEEELHQHMKELDPDNLRNFINSLDEDQYSNLMRLLKDIEDDVNDDYDDQDYPPRFSHKKVFDA